jgi:peptidoglycan/xylan/chitin deacetylase (PgdA/CDA1 family)
LVGRYVEQYPDLVKQIYQSGHQLGIHGFRHLPFPLEKPATLQTQLDHARNALANACGISPETIKDLRPPYGAFTSKLVSMLTEWGYQLVLWNNIPPHWMQPLSWTIKQVLGQIHPGSIIVLHDGHADTGPRSHKFLISSFQNSKPRDMVLLQSSKYVKGKAKPHATYQYQSWRRTNTSTERPC